MGMPQMPKTGGISSRLNIFIMFPKMSKLHDIIVLNKGEIKYLYMNKCNKHRVYQMIWKTGEELIRLNEEFIGSGYVLIRNRVYIIMEINLKALDALELEIGILPLDELGIDYCLKIEL
jgi:hypothetical protein